MAVDLSAVPSRQENNNIMQHRAPTNLSHSNGKVLVLNTLIMLLQLSRQQWPQVLTAAWKCLAGFLVYLRRESLLITSQYFHLSGHVKEELGCYPDTENY